MTTNRDAHDDLTFVTTVRLTQAEHQRLQVAAAERGISLSALIRLAINRATIPEPRPPRIDLEAVMQLRRIGNLLNQYLRILHRELTRHNGKEWLDTIFRFRDQTKALRALVDELKEGLS